MMLQIPLYILAQNNDLPKHQFMDSPTLDWILKNKPSFNCRQGLIIDPLTIITKYVQRYSPLEEWFEDKSLISSIHGKRHILRCIALTGILHEAEQLSVDADELCLVAALHDIRRTSDNEDGGHAEKAAHWVKDNINQIAKSYKYNIGQTLINKIYLTISFHNKLEYPEPLDHSLNELVDSFKMIDALDRYRQPKIKWWLDEKYLKTKPSCSIKEKAFELVVKSEEYALSGYSDEESISKAIYDIS